MILAVDFLDVYFLAAVIFTFLIAAQQRYGCCAGCGGNRFPIQSGNGIDVRCFFDGGSDIDQKVGRTKRNLLLTRNGICGGPALHIDGAILE